MERKRFKKNLMMVIMAVAMMIGGVMVVPRTASAAVTDTVLRWPTNNTKLSQNFSATSKSVHQGVDIPGTLNDSIYAAEAGTIVSRGCIKGGYGNYIVIQHQSGLFTLYGHLNKYAANTEVNKKVTKGQVIAYMGNTGYSTGVHLHFEVRKVKTLYYDYQLSEIQKNLYNPMSFKYVYSGDTTAPKISNWKVTSVTSEGATIECDITDNVKVTKSQITVWKATEKGETAKFYNPVSVNGNHYTFKWSISDFNSYRGQYKTNIHAWDAAGNKTMQSYATNGYLLYTIPQPVNNKPVGWVDSVVHDKVGYIHVQGWAYDPDSKNTSLDIHVYVGGPSSPTVPCAVIKANVKRTDVNKVHGCGDYHGFEAQIATNRTGNVPVYIYAIDTSGGENPQLRCVTVNVPVHTHNYNIPGNITKAATCTENGTQVYKCSCSATTTKSINCTGHNWNDGEITTAPTCTEDGVITYTCTKCGETETETIEKTGHEIVTDAAVEATYTTTGLTEGSHCAKCNAVLKSQETVPMLMQEPQVSQSASENQVPPTTALSADTKSVQANQSDIQEDADIADVNDDNGNAIATNADFEYEIDEDDEVMYCSPNNLDVKVIIIPDTVIIDGETYEVTSIDDDAFKNCKNLTKVVIGRNITEIGDRAFKGCSKLKNIEIETTELTKKSIGKNAFKGIGKKATFKFPKKVYKKYKKWIKRVGAPVNARYKKFG